MTNKKLSRKQRAEEERKRIAAPYEAKRALKARKQRFRAEVAKAVRRGDLIRDECAHKGKNGWCTDKLEFHHLSYEPGHELDVVCLCSRCHHILHQRLIEMGERIPTGEPEPAIKQRRRRKRRKKRKLNEFKPLAATTDILFWSDNDE